MSMQTTTKTQDIGQCRKCQSEIPLEAERCPNCAFEPQVGLFGKLAVWVSLMLGSTAAAISLISLIIIFDTADVQTGLIGFGVFGFIALFFFGVIKQKWETYKQKPAIQPDEEADSVDLEDAVDDMKNSWREGSERGERIAESVESRYEELVRTIPASGRVAGITIGVLLSFSSWPLAALEYEAAMSVALGGGMFLTFLFIYLDVEDVNRRKDTDFRWWAYSIPPAIPVFGFPLAAVWLYKKRQKTGSVFG